MNLNSIKGMVSKALGYLVFDVSIKLMPFFILPYFSHTLSMTEFKSVSLFIVIISFLLTLLPLGVSTKVLLKLTENSDNKLYLPSAVFFPALLMLILLFFSSKVAGIVSLQSEDLRYLVLIAFNLTIGQIIAIRYQAEQKSFIYGSIMFLLQASFYFPLLFFVSTHGSLTNTANSFNLCLLFQVVLITGFVVYEKNNSLPKIVFSMSEVKLYSLFIIGILIHILVNSIRFVYDRFFMASMPSDIDFVRYNIAMQVAMILSVLFVSFNRFWSSFYFSNKSRINTFHYLMGVLFIALASIFVYFFGYFYITLFFPIEYHLAFELLPFLVVSYLFQGLYLLFSAKLYSEKNFKAINLSSLISLLLSISLMHILYEEYGSTGVAVSVLISWSSLFVLIFFYIIKPKLKVIK